MNQARYCSPVVRRLVFGAIVFHGLCVLAEPLRFFSRSESMPAAPEFGILREVTAPYVEWMYLDHGYFFFAPNPGPSHLIHVRDRDSNDGPFQFPNRREQFPRLMYHRYFMLSEFYNDRFAPTSLPPDVKPDSPLMARWKEDRAMYSSIQDSIKRSFVFHRKYKNPELIRLERELPDTYRVLEKNIPIDDVQFLRVLAEGPERAPSSNDQHSIPMMAPEQLETIETPTSRSEP